MKAVNWSNMNPMRWRRRTKLFGVAGGLVVVLAVFLVMGFVTGFPGGGKLLGYAGYGEGNRDPYSLLLMAPGYQTNCVELRNDNSVVITLGAWTASEWRSYPQNPKPARGTDTLQPGQSRRYYYFKDWRIQTRPEGLRSLYRIT